MKKNREKYYRYGMLGLIILFFLFWFFFDGINVSADTESYVNFTMSREPVYPILLALFRATFGQNYFAWVGLFQSLFWAYVVWYLCDVLYREMKLSTSLYLVLIGINFFVCLITRFLTGRKALYSLDIATEGIAIPLYILFITDLFLFVIHQKKIHLIKVLLFGILLISLRKQMYIVLLIMGITFGILWLCKRVKFSKLICLWMLTGATLLCAVLLDKGYNYVIRGEAVRHSADSSALLINAIYVSSESDAILFENEEVRNLFLDIVRTKTENGWGYESRPEGGGQLYEHYSNNFDNIAFKIVNPKFYEFLSEQGIEGYVEQELAFGELNDYMFSKLLSDNIGKIIHVFIANTGAGFCNTIAKDSAILIPIIILFYMTYIVVGVYLGGKKKLVPEVCFAGVVAIGLLTNVLAVSVMIFSQSRYMIYNMPLFYCALCVMIYRIIEMRQGEKI